MKTVDNVIINFDMLSVLDDIKDSIKKQRIENSNKAKSVTLTMTISGITAVISVLLILFICRESTEYISNMSMFFIEIGAGAVIFVLLCAVLSSPADKVCDVGYNSTALEDESDLDKLEEKVDRFRNSVTSINNEIVVMEFLNNFDFMNSIIHNWSGIVRLRSHDCVAFIDESKCIVHAYDKTAKDSFSIDIKASFISENSDSKIQLIIDKKSAHCKSNYIDKLKTKVL